MARSKIPPGISINPSIHQSINQAQPSSPSVAEKNARQNKSPTHPQPGSLQRLSSSRAMHYAPGTRPDKRILQIKQDTNQPSSPRVPFPFSLRCNAQPRTRHQSNEEAKSRMPKSKKPKHLRFPLQCHLSSGETVVSGLSACLLRSFVSPCLCSLLPSRILPTLLEFFLYRYLVFVPSRLSPSRTSDISDNFKG